MDVKYSALIHTFDDGISLLFPFYLLLFSPHLTVLFKQTHGLFVSLSGSENGVDAK